MAKFFVVGAMQIGSDDFEVAGIFTRQFDADTFISEHERSGEYFAVAPPPRHLEMAVILDMLVRDRLRDLAEPIAKLAATVMPNVELSGQTAGLSPEGRARTQCYAYAVKMEKDT